MPFPMKVQPIDSSTYRDIESVKNDTVKPLLKSRLKRFFDRPFPSVLRISSAAEKPGAGNDGAASEFEPSSVCLDKLVQNFIEENNDKPSNTRFGRTCNCFNGNNNNAFSDDEFDFSTGFSDSIMSSSFGDSSDTLKSLIPCASVAERNLLADTSKIVEKNKSCKLKDDLRKIITDELLTLGYNASICKSKWEKASSIPAGEYEYIDATVEGERVILDVDFRSEFEIARSTGRYKAILQLLPFIFVGKADRLQQIVSIVAESARQSLKKKGMHIAPWRNPEYMKAKWLSPYTRITTALRATGAEESDAAAESKEAAPENKYGELDLIFAEKTSSLDFDYTETKLSEKTSREEVMPLQHPVMMTWQPPAVKPKSCDRRTEVVITGLASLLREKP